MPIRNSAKAIIIHGDKVLLTKNQSRENFFYLFPGGGQEHKETLHSALKRECIEEVGCQIEVGELLHIREYIGENHELAKSHFDAHQVEFYFVCSLINEDINKPTNPDTNQVGMEWVEIQDLLDYNVYPRELRKHIINYFNDNKSLVYLGDIN